MDSTQNGLQLVGGDGSAEEDQSDRNDRCAKGDGKNQRENGGLREKSSVIGRLQRIAQRIGSTYNKPETNTGLAAAMRNLLLLTTFGFWV